MSAVPEWMRPPRPEGWFADDLDHLPEAPRHTELLDGALVFMMSPQRAWHSRVVSALLFALAEQAPPGVEIEREMTIRLDPRNRPEPDLLATNAPYYDPDRTFYTPDQVLLVVEVVSPESAHRDRTIKLRKYAEAGIGNYWRVEEEGSPVIHTYELDGPTQLYAPTGIHRHELRVTTPFAIKIDLDGLVPGRKI
ncbi:Uma2 family endonuclease [Micromonospora sp. NPDC005979]|uniref:Uma2 family endonuclease n=1 Tax=Micromonospora sp. NPDC005979 TaxID=3156726 RepID=UPI0033A537E4